MGINSLTPSTYLLTITTLINTWGHS